MAKRTDCCTSTCLASASLRCDCRLACRANQWASTRLAFHQKGLPWVAGRFLYAQGVVSPRCVTPGQTDPATPQSCDRHTAHFQSFKIWSRSLQEDGGGEGTCCCSRGRGGASASHSVSAHGALCCIEAQRRVFQARLLLASAVNACTHTRIFVHTTSRARSKEHAVHLTLMWPPTMSLIQCRPAPPSGPVGPNR